MRFKTPAERTSFIVLFGCSMLLAGAAFFPLWKALLLGAVLAATLDSWNERLVRRVRGRRTLAASLTTAGVMLLGLLPVGIVVGFAVKEAVSAIAFVRSALGEGGGLLSLIKLLPQWAQSWIGHLQGLMPADALQSSGAWLADQAGTLFSASSEAVFQIAMALITLFFLLVDGRELIQWVIRHLPLGEAATRDLFHEFRGVSRSVIGSTVATVTAQGLAAGIGYRIAGVPNAFFFGMVTWFAAFIPSVGTALVALPLTAHLYLTGHPYRGTFLLVWSVLVVGLVDNLLKPLLARSERMNGAITFFAFIGGLIIWGGIGLVAGPLAVSFFLTMVRLSRSEPAPSA